MITVYEKPHSFCVVLGKHDALKDHSIRVYPDIASALATETRADIVNALQMMGGNYTPRKTHKTKLMPEPVIESANHAPDGSPCEETLDIRTQAYVHAFGDAQYALDVAARLAELINERTLN
jgi:hypothetical protein